MSPRIVAVIGAVLWAVAALGRANPVLYLIGDSTLRTGTPGQQGWGDALGRWFDPAKLEVINRAIGGRSSRTYLTDGRWDALLANLRAGDYVIIEFGHNDGGPINDERCRASIKGNGEETEVIVRKLDGKPETVRSYGWYLRKYISDAHAKGAIPIVLSPIPRNIWKDGKIVREDQGLGLWAKQAAAQQGALFIDFNRILAERLDALGQTKTAELFAGTDHTHTAPAGAEFNAAAMVGALRGLAGCPLAKDLLDEHLWLPAVFAEHMVLQREQALAVWGQALPGAAVTVKLAGRGATTTADAKGAWKVELPALAAGGPYQLEVAAGAATRSYGDVLVGDVWLCSGQSNMDFTLAKTAKRAFAGAADWENEVAAANHPQLRMFTAEWTMSERPQADVAGAWAVCTPRTAGDFSAVAYYFGRRLQQQLKVPVGLVTCAYGASTIEAWIREESLAAHPQFGGLLQAFDKKALEFRDNPKLLLDYGNALAKTRGGRAPKNPDPFRDQHNPSVLYNGMLAPLIPYGIRGVIWYQGESNLNTRQLYPDLQQTLIEDWRQLWNHPALPFYFVQLAAYKAPSSEPSGGQLAEMREAQAKALTLPHTGMAVTIDVGDEKDVHPRNKRDVGARLAALALTDTYGLPGEASGPVLVRQEVQDGRIRLSFSHAAGGLVAKGGALRQFAIAAADRKFVWAEAVVEGDSLRVSSPAVAHPAYVRYAWADNPQGANLYNSAGFPAAPFRTDP